MGDSDRLRLGAMNLAAAAEKLEMDPSLTYTPNQKDHPGMSHLHKSKESKEWTKSTQVVWLRKYNICTYNICLF